MERLHHLLHALDPQQVKVLKNYLTGFSTRDGNTKLWELAALVLSDKNKIPGEKARSKKAIYKTKNAERKNRLKNRLYIKVLDSLLIDINTDRDIYEDEAHPIQVRLRKKMILYDLFKFTPLKLTVGMELLNDIISAAKEYEFHSILLEAMYIYKGNYGFRKGTEFFNKVSKEITYYEKCNQYAQRARDLYLELSLYSTFETKADKNKLEEFLQKSIAELRQYSLETNVKSVGYFLKTFELTHLQFNKKNIEAREIAISMIEFLKKNRAVGRKARFGIAYGTIAEIEMRIGDYDSAMKYLYKGREYFSGSAMNLAISKTIETDILFLKGDYQKAKEMATSLANDHSKVTGDFRRDIMLYYKASCHFMLGEYREAARLFNLKFQLTRDKLGWEVNIRFMRILAMLELNRPDEATMMVENVYQHIRHYKQIKYLNERDQMLLKLFRELAMEGFGFGTPNHKIYHLLLQLQEAEKPHSWEVLSPELIPIHNWVIKKYGRLVPPGEYRLKKKKVFKTAARM